MPAISMHHDPDTGEWTVTAGGHVLTTKQTPDCQTWWLWLREKDPAEAEQWRGDQVRAAFDSSVARTRDSCYCDGCRGSIKLVIPETGEIVGHVSSDGRVRMAKRPLTYKQARTRYMGTGSITDKDAMVDCVTMTIPDLDTIGTDWEPAKPKPEAAVVVPKPRIARNACRISLSGAGALLSVLAVTAVLPKTFALVAVVCALASVVLGFVPKARR